ncbi:MAG: response regulator [Polyangiaceae bacterium]|nr:response regulator [Polyangiaceae bacterium]
MGQSVLIFESDAEFAGELRAELERLDCQVQVVDDGVAGLQQAALAQPDLILLSIELPRMNGFSVCNKLKKDPSLRDIPLIIMSSESSDETFVQHQKLRTRAEDYVHKPIAFSDLLTHIEPLVSIAPPPETAYRTPGTAYIEEPETPAPTMIAHTIELDGAELESGELEPAELEPAEPESGSDAIVPESRQSDRVQAPERDSDRVQVLERDVDSAKAQISRLAQELLAAQRQSEQARREAEDARARAVAASAARSTPPVSNAARSTPPTPSAPPPPPPPGPPGSGREILNLREALNKKDRELLALREGLGKKDREIVETRERSLALELQKADLDDKVLEQERALADYGDKLASLQADKEQAKKAGEDFRRRAERAQQEAEARTKELTEIKDNLTQEIAAREAAARAEADAAITHAMQVHQNALAQADAENRAAIDSAQATLEATQKAAEQEQAEALAEQRQELAIEYEAQAAAVARDHHGKITKMAAEHEAAMAAMMSGHAEALAEASRTHEQELTLQKSVLETEYNERVAAALADVAIARKDGDKRVALAEKMAADKHAFAEQEAANKLTALEGELESIRQMWGKQTEELAYAVAARNGFELDVVRAREHVAMLEADLAATKAAHDEIKEQLLTQTGRLDKALAKIEADKSSLDRAKDALTVALAQIEEAEARTTS